MLALAAAIIALAAAARPVSDFYTRTPSGLVLSHCIYDVSGVVVTKISDKLTQ